MKKILVTGGAGFIGYHLTKRLLMSGDYYVVGIDNLNEYYDKKLKLDRLSDINSDKSRYTFYESDISNAHELQDIFIKEKIDIVVNLAAQAGVRYSKENPDSYIRSNIIGFYNILNLCKEYSIDKLIYASSSSVYGDNDITPFRETDNCTSPMSLYAATKLSNELLAKSYYYSFGLKSVGLRFFNIYGPWGRPDMAYFKWADNLTRNEKLELRNFGEMYRDMTYIDDAINCIDLIISNKHIQGSEVYNVGNQDPVKIIDMMNYLISIFKIKDHNIKNVTSGSDEPIKTWADTSKLFDLIKYTPNTNYKKGLDNFHKWYIEYYKI